MLNQAWKFLHCRNSNSEQRWPATPIVDIALGTVMAIDDRRRLGKGTQNMGNCRRHAQIPAYMGHRAVEYRCVNYLSERQC